MLLQCLAKCNRFTKPLIKCPTNSYSHHYLQWRSFTIRPNTIHENLHLKFHTNGSKLLAKPQARPVNLWLIRLKKTVAPELRQPKAPKVKLKRGDIMRLISLAKSEKLVLAGKFVGLWTIIY